MNKHNDKNNLHKLTQSLGQISVQQISLGHLLQRFDLRLSTVRLQPLQFSSQRLIHIRTTRHRAQQTGVRVGQRSCGQPEARQFGGSHTQPLASRHGQLFGAHGQRNAAVAIGQHDLDAVGVGIAQHVGGQTQVQPQLAEQIPGVDVRIALAGEQNAAVLEATDDVLQQQFVEDRVLLDDQHQTCGRCDVQYVGEKLG